MWYHRQYLLDPTTWSNWDGSPILTPELLFARALPIWIVVCKLDLLRDEGLAYGKKLKEQGVKVVAKCYDRAPHETYALDGVMQLSRVMIADVIHALKEALWSI